MDGHVAAGSDRHVALLEIGQMAFFAQVRKTDDLVVALTVLDPAQAVNFPSDADTSLVPITQAQYDTANAQGLLYQGSDIPRFKFVTPNFVINPDTRPIVTFTPVGPIKADVDEVVTVQIDHDGGIDGRMEFFLAGVPMRITFVNGTAMGVVIDTGQPADFSINGQQAFQVPTPLRVTVYASKIGPRS